MGQKGSEPTQTTPGGTEIPVPRRSDFLADLNRVAKVAPQTDDPPYPPEHETQLLALARTKVTNPDPEWCWYIAHTDGAGWLTEALRWREPHMALDWQTRDRAEQALALLAPDVAEVVSDPRR